MAEENKDKPKFNLREALTKQGATLDDTQISFVSAFESALSERFALEEKYTSEMFGDALREALGELPKDEEGKVLTIADQIREIASNLDKIEKRTTNALNGKEKFQLRKMIKEQHEQIVESMRSGGGFSIGFNAMSARAADVHTNTNTYTDAGTFIMPDVENFSTDDEIAKIRYPENFILTIFRNRQVSKVPQQVIKKEQEPVEGAVAVVAEGGTKPLVQYQFVRTTTSREKYAGRIEWTEEFEMDNERLYTEIVNMFESDTIRTWQDGLLAQMIANAVAYTTSALDGTLPRPDNGIACIAAASVIDAMNYNADTVAMHPSDVIATMFTQDADGNWRLIPYMQNGTINGMRLIQSNKITEGDALIGDSSTYKEEHSSFILRFGMYNDQFIKNEKSAIGEVFSLLWIAQRDLPSWMYIDLDAVKLSLTEV